MPFTIAKGIKQGSRWDLTGGGLIRSTVGWAAVKSLRKEMVHVKSDERILGDGDFVARILAQSQEGYETRYALKARGVALEDVAARVAELLGMQAEQVWQAGKTRPQVKARLLCYWELGKSMTAMARRLGISTAAVSKAISRGAKIASQNGYSIRRS